METTKGDTVTRTVEQLRAEAMSLTRGMSTDDLVTAFEATDGMLTDLTSGVDAGQSMSAVDRDAYASVTTARGFMLDVLEERGDLGRVMEL